MRWLNSVCLVLLSLLLACCASKPDISPSALQMPEIKLAPSALGASISLAQRLTLVNTGSPDINARPQAQRTLDALLEIDSDSVRLAGFAMSQRVLTLAWDGKALNSTRHFLLPAEVNADKVLRDIELSYWPAEAIRAVLPSDWTLLDVGSDKSDDKKNDAVNERSLRYKGETQVLIHYSATPRWAGRAELDNRLEHYRLTIESTVQSSPTP